MPKPLTAIPTNIITGFLGVGKTTAILNLLKQKPTDEKWAVLVNEFGEVGIDGSLIKGKETQEQGVFIREVPGGCMCCAAGLPMQVALNTLLATAKPDRLLIEPSGLGHPKEVVSVLSASHYQEVLDLRHTITLIDARKVSDKRYIEHDCFIQQLDIADVIVANKADLYDVDDLKNLKSFLKNNSHLQDKPIYPVSHAELSRDWLTGKGKNSQPDHHHHNHANDSQTSLPLPGNDNFPESGFLSVENQGEGFVSYGWLFKPEFTFCENKLYELLLGIEVDRLKAVFITEQGVIGYNKVDDVLTQINLDEASESRIELIALDERPLTDYQNQIQEQLLNAIVKA
jgi:G3E family GTPase